METQMKCALRIFAVLPLLLITSAPAVERKSAVALALLEERAEDEKDKDGEEVQVYRQRVRAAFLSRDGRWEAVCQRDNYGETSCKEDSMTLFSTLYLRDHEGVRAARFAGAKEREWYSDIGLLLAKSAVTSWSGDRLMEFAGWQHIPLARPIPVTSRNAVPKDPDSWKISNVDASSRRAASLEMARRLESLGICRRMHLKWRDGVGKDALKIKAAWSNKAGAGLMVIGLSDAGREACSGLPAGQEQLDDRLGELLISRTPGRAWVVLPESATNTQRAGTFALIEMADFDGDGKSEALFFYSGYNRDGYVLLHSGMTKKVEFMWGYH